MLGGSEEREEHFGEQRGGSQGTGEVVFHLMSEVDIARVEWASQRVRSDTG